MRNARGQQRVVEMREGAGIEDDWNAAPAEAAGGARAACPPTRSPTRWRGEPGAGGRRRRGRPGHRMPGRRTLALLWYCSVS